jgi:hypothetical protein
LRSVLARSRNLAMSCCMPACICAIFCSLAVSWALLRASAASLDFGPSPPEAVAAEAAG